ncbi:MAG: ribH [Bacteroidetes bacterium]|nr:ribH [Bacteroidota bacterium]
MSISCAIGCTNVVAVTFFFLQIYHLATYEGLIVETIQGTLSATGRSFGIVVSRFNSLVTGRLLDGAMDCLLRHDADEKAITVVYCPGSYEIPQVALQMANSGRFDAIITLGCVVRGETPHFDYIASETAKGISQVAMQTGIPTAFGVLTTETLEQALERAGAKSGNKGWDAALTAIELVQISQKLSGGKKRPKA